MSNLKKFEEATFEEEVLKSEGVVLVDFYADWCGPCKMMAPVINQIATEFEGRLTVGERDGDADPGIAMRCAIMGIPTLAISADGKLADRLVAYPGPSGIRAFVEKNT